MHRRSQPPTTQKRNRNQFPTTSFCSIAQLYARQNTKFHTNILSNYFKRMPFCFHSANDLLNLVKTTEALPVTQPSSARLIGKPSRARFILFLCFTSRTRQTCQESVMRNYMLSLGNAPATCGRAHKVATPRRISVATFSNRRSGAPCDLKLLSRLATNPGRIAIIINPP